MHSPLGAAAPTPRSPAPSRATTPVALVAGLALMAGAFVLDVAAHAAALTSVEPTAHVAGILGMLIAWGAVVVDGLRPTARRA